MGEQPKKPPEGEEEDKKQPEPPEVYVYGDRFEWTEEEYTKFLNQYKVAELDKRLDDTRYDVEEGTKLNKKGRVSILASYYTSFNVRVDAMIARFLVRGVTATKIQRDEGKGGDESKGGDEGVDA